MKEHKESKHKLVDIGSLRSHEQIRPKHYHELRERITKNRYIKPIIVDANSNVILDGHHRFNVMKDLGFKHMPAFVVDYKSDDIKVLPRRKDIPVSKEAVVDHGMKGNLYPPKTTKHIMEDAGDVRVPIDSLERENKDVLKLIGNTPLVEIRKLNTNTDVKIFAKLEGYNPGGSIKDRPALYMIEEAESTGKFVKGKTILEATSGNTGIALAMIAAVKGYDVIAVMPESASMERRHILKAYGAQIILTPKEKGTDGAVEKANEMLKENPEKYFMPDQYSNKSNVRAHYEGTGSEILKQTNGEIDVFVSALGTTGTLVGAGRRLKEFNNKIKVLAVEPEVGHKIQGLKNMEESKVPGIYDKSVWDEKVIVKTDDAFEMTKLLAKKEGLLVGMSSGAAMWAALQEAKKMKSGKIVVIFPDRGDRYLSCSLFC